MKVAVAHPNIALVKYWGKSDATKNIPATPSLSVTLSDLYVTTAVEETMTDDIVLNDIGVEDQKLTTWLSRFRRAFRAPPVRVISHGNFPARSGLASSAAGFAALVTILNEHFQLELNKSELDEWARLGSASAARSLYGGFVTLQPRTNDCEVQTIKTAEDWPLAVIVAITSTHAKTISSSVGMMRTANTSPYYTAWLNSTRNDFVECVSAVETKDFDKLANISERSCRKMHALMLSTEPPLIYWNPTTLAGIQAHP